MECVLSPIFLLSWAAQVAAVCLASTHLASPAGSALVQYAALVAALTTLDACDALSDSKAALLGGGLEDSVHAQHGAAAAVPLG